ncbi:MAG: HAD hydrolase-like protein [Rickettsiales bacterium]|nr:HAD hydrolase-like protein [Rickettsiales bacterium]
MIVNSILDIKDDFDLYLFDAYGVFWDGRKLIDATLEVMENLVKSGKTVCILTNMPKSSVEAEKHYESEGLTKGKYYNFMFTSGQVMLDNIQNNPKFKDKKIFNLWPIYNPNMLNNTGCVEVKNLAEADIIYVDVPIFMENEVNEFITKYNFSKEDFYLYKGVHLCLNEKVFDVLVENIKNVNDRATVINACNDREIKFDDIFAKGPAVVNERFEKQGFKTLFFGKPDKNTYECIFNDLKHKGIEVNKNRTIMIGDTLENDILGAKNSNIKNLLVFTENSVTYNRIKKSLNIQCSVNDLLEKCKDLEKDLKVNVDYYLI